MELQSKLATSVFFSQTVKNLDGNFLIKFGFQLTHISIYFFQKCLFVYFIIYFHNKEQLFHQIMEKSINLGSGIKWLKNESKNEFETCYVNTVDYVSIMVYQLN